MRLHVCIGGRIAATLAEESGEAELSYLPAWQCDPMAFALSHALPLGVRIHRGPALLNFLWGLLPDDDRLLRTWQRWFDVSARDPVSLLAHVGEDCAGAVQFVTEARIDEIVGGNDTPAAVTWLEPHEVEKRIRELVRDPAAGRTRDENQCALAGAQAKTALHFDAVRRRWDVPGGRTPTTHILKPVANEFDGFAENEHFCMTLARRIGLAAARTEWQSIGGVPTLIADRYDRVHAGGRWSRVHQEDCCQALGISPRFKYENEGGPGFKDILSLLQGGDDPHGDRDQLMRAACLTYLIAASDAHAKNYSILHGPGALRPSMRLAPFYDIASAWPYARQLQLQKLKLAMRIGGHYRIREILPRHFNKMAVACNHPPVLLMGILRALCEVLPDESAAVAREVASERGSQSVLARLVDGIAAQCRSVARQLSASEAVA